MKRYIERCVYVVFALTVASEIVDMDDSSSCKEVLAINESLWLVAMCRDALDMLFYLIYCEGTR